MKWQPPVSTEEIETIARAMHLAGDVFRSRYVQVYPVKANSYLLSRRNDACSFLKFEGTESTCLIHEYRPAACRDWKPNLSRRECQEGLRRLEPDAVRVPTKLYASPGEISQLCSACKTPVVHRHDIMSTAKESQVEREGRKLNDEQDEEDGHSEASASYEENEGQETRSGSRCAHQGKTGTS